MKMRKHTLIEFKAYRAAGKIAEEILSSLRTVLALGLQKKAIKAYGDELKNAEAAGIKKGFVKFKFIQRYPICKA